MRRFLDARGYLEVETPVLWPSAGGATANPFATRARSFSAGNDEAAAAAAAAGGDDNGKEGKEDKEGKEGKEDKDGNTDTLFMRIAPELFLKQVRVSGVTHSLLQQQSTLTALRPPWTATSIATRIATSMT